MVIKKNKSSCFVESKIGFTIRCYGFLIAGLIFFFGMSLLMPRDDRVDFFISSFSDANIKSLIFISLFIISMQIYDFYAPRNYIIKKMELKLDLIILHFFNGKKINIKYKDIESCVQKYCHKPPATFIFNLKNGDTKYIFARLKNQQEAFDLISQKIKEANS